MTASTDLSQAIAAAKRAIGERKTASESSRHDVGLRRMRKALKRLQRRRRTDLARQTRLTAKTTKKANASPAAPAGAGST